MATKCIFVLILSCTLLSSVCLAQLSNVNIEQAVENLANRFQEIRNEGLGVDRLEEAYGDAEFIFETITPEQINTALSDSTLSGPIDSVNSFIDAFDTTIQTASPVSPEDCCTTTGLNACCFECSSNLTANQASLRDRITGALSSYNRSAGSRLLFGFNDGPVIMHPPTSADCADTVLDARLQQWYRQAIQARSLEVVVLLDASNPDPRFYRNENIEALRDMAGDILRSLTNMDRAAIVRADRNTPLPLVISRQSMNVEDLRTVAVSDEVISEFEPFTTSVSDLEGPVNITASFRQSVDLFSDNPNTDKVLVTLLPGIASVITSAVDHLEQLIIARGNDILVSSYRGVSDGGTDADYQRLANLGRGGGVDIALPFDPPLPPLEPLAGMFASLYLPTQLTTVNLVVDEDFTLERRVLTLSEALTNGTDLIGVLHAELPWDDLLSAVSPILVNRESSYVFAVHPESLNVLFHPLIPGGLLESVPVSQVEADVNIGALLGSVSSGSTLSMPVLKTMLDPANSIDESIGFVIRQVQSTYYCTQASVLFVCVLLADEDRTVASLNQTSVNLPEIYSANPSRLPLYHNLMLSAGDAESCDYFCKATVTDRISFQLTSPSQPPTADTAMLVDDVTDYIRGPGTRPAWVDESVATDIGLGSAVATSWINNINTASDYITRRHFATPSGAYLTYPPTQFVSNYNPRSTDWYISSRAHPSLITLTPPRTALQEGSRLTVSLGYALKSPTSESDSSFTNGGQTMSVVAADLTLDSLRAFIRQALPICHQNNAVSCLIIDDLGNIIYDDVVVNSIRYDGDLDAFVSTPFNGDDFNSRRAMVTSLLMGNSGLLTKRECEDHFIVGIGTMRFYSMDMSLNTSVSGMGGGGCTEYSIQRIPGTNAFLAVIRETRQCFTQFCLCTEDTIFPDCNDCVDFSATGCECPCICREGRDVPLVCPRRQFEEVNQDAVATTASPTQDTCFNQACNCRTTQDSCLGVRECSWCSAEQKCVYNTECCNPDSEDCCNNGAQSSRFILLTCNLQPVCEAGTELTADCPTPAPESNSAVIVGGVVGGLFAVLLLTFIVVLFVWYQFCRREDPKDEHSRESAFDFSNKRTEATNPSSTDVQSVDGAKSAKSTSPGTSSHAQLVDGEKVDSSSEKTEKTESTNL